MFQNSESPFRLSCLVVCAGLAAISTGVADSVAQTSPGQAEQAASGVRRLSLDECISIALRENSDILIAERRAERAGGVALSSWSTVLPTVSANVFNTSRFVRGEQVSEQTVQETRPDGSIGFVRSTVSSPGFAIPSYSAGITANQMIYNGGASWNIIKQAKQNARATELNADATENRTAMTVKQQYYNLLKAIRTHEVQLEQVKLSSEQLRQSETMYKLGTEAKVAVLTARANWGRSRIVLITQESAIRQAKAALNTSMGRPAAAPVDVVDMIDPETASFPAPMGLDAAISAAMDRNPDIRSSSAQVRTARLGKKVATGGLLPTVTAFFNYNRSNSELNRLFNNLGQNWSYNYGVSFSLSILNGTRTYGAISQARADYYIAEEGLEQQRRNTILAIEQSIAGLDAAHQIIAISRDAIEAAQESLRLEQSRYRVGTGRQLDVIDAQLRFTQARNDLIAALYDYKIAEASLDNAMGTTDYAVR
jgi:outer membrane protein